MSNCDNCVGCPDDAEIHRLCDDCMQEQIEADEAAHAEKDAEIARLRTELAEARAERDEARRERDKRPDISPKSANAVVDWWDSDNAPSTADVCAAIATLRAHAASATKGCE